ncbi:MAG: hypothetical protein COA62_15525 [Rhodobiaceae bacterium]|nr:MAG: hypothetical protein COA62_15525 [Rhodobiaceae bacterium]
MHKWIVMERSQSYFVFLSFALGAVAHTGPPGPLKGVLWEGWCFFAEKALEGVRGRIFSDQENLQENWLLTLKTH